MIIVYQTKVCKASLSSVKYSQIRIVINNSLLLGRKMGVTVPDELPFLHYNIIIMFQKHFLHSFVITTAVCNGQLL